MSDASGGAPGGESRGEPEAPFSRSRAADAAKPAGEQTPDFQAHVRAARSEFESQVAHARAEFEEANERIKQRTGRDLIGAILIGLAIGLALIASLIFLKQVFILFALAASTLGIFELHRALTGAGRRVDIVPQLAAGTVLVIAGYFADPWLHWVTVFAAVAFVVVWRMIAQMAARDGRTYGLVLGDVLIAAFVQLYVPFLTSLCVALLSQDHGEWWVLAFIIVVVASDTGAYAAGLSFGKHPMAPRISPKKTWEGFAGAAAAALVAGVLLAIFMLHLPAWTGVVIGALILLTATLGDLGESMVKRDIGIKDMSSWLPGHGGVLDRLDSILPSAAAALALYYLLNPLAAS
ncbi:phosphatidate cytidylyltransferase [Microbacterium ulmi]|uniref:Phosphatidate cytidylyltransferase n=1 Tax=Microbacterium ulmi TaxID=179095 RepID=A0A7Y2LX89_9MICO|nr:phosphatidate cytidylyltransferase [Microbacterium ulmi]NII71206.1 phosphatidate cytidylyltransferase [Microbacterium ulmi]NNH02511.1 phosphatidate cytidylyltransferase [Microbacterium ulmi]